MRFELHLVCNKRAVRWQVEFGTGRLEMTDHRGKIMISSKARKL